MRKQAAIKVINKALKPTMQRLAFGANLYEAGLVEIFCIRDHKERERIREALLTLSRDGGPVQLSMLI